MRRGFWIANDRWALALSERGERPINFTQAAHFLGLFSSAHVLQCDTSIMAKCSLAYLMQVRRQISIHCFNASASVSRR
jgi:hypothetical protein